jgi:hypothetical protein
VRFKHFVKRVLPKLRENPQPGALVFVRSYFDFVRVRNLLTSEAGRAPSCVEGFGFRGSVVG